MVTESDRIREQIANPMWGGSQPAHITPPGVPLSGVISDPRMRQQLQNFQASDEQQALNRAEEAEDAAAAEAAANAPPPARQIRSEEEAQRLKQDMEELGRDGMSEHDWARRVGKLRLWREEHPKDIPESEKPPLPQSLATSPQPTGIERIDKAGQSVWRRPVGPAGMAYQEDIPSLEGKRPDHPDMIKKQRADEGIDMTSGGPLKERALIATTPTVRQQGDELKNFVDSYRDELPDDLKNQAIQYDPLLQQWLFLQPDTEDPNKWRYTTMEGTGLELGDLGDMMDPAEILGLAGSLGGVFLTPQGKVGALGKVFTLGMKGPNARMAATGLTGGVGGRLEGHAMEIIGTYMRTGGESYPTYAEMLDLGWDAGKIELFCTLAGELGAKILRTTSNVIQDFGARSEGKLGVFTNPERVEIANANIRQTQRDMKNMKDVLGYDAMYVTPGTASHSIEVLSHEGMAIKSTSAKIRERFTIKEAQGKRGLQDYIHKVWGEDGGRYFDPEAVIIAANDAITGAGRISVAQTSDNVIHFAPRGTTNAAGEAVSDVPAGFGVHVLPDGDVWRVQTSNLIDKEADLTNVGIGFELYKASHAEARAHGARLVSDSNVSPDAVRMWEKLKKEPGIKIKRNHADWDDEAQQWVSEGPMFEEIVPRSYTEALLEGYTKARKKMGDGPRVLPKRGEDGRILPSEPQAEFSRFLSKPARSELGAIEADISFNPLMKQRFREAILEDYDRAVITQNKKGQDVIDQDFFEEWIATKGETVSKFFTPEEMLHIRHQPGALAHYTLTNKAAMDAYGAEINRLLPDVDIGVKSLLREENQRLIWDQVNSMTGKQQRQLFKLLDNVPGMERGVLGDRVRMMMQDELETSLLAASKTGNYLGFEKWLTKNNALIRNVFPAEATVWIRNLGLVKNVLKQRSDRAMVVGSGAEANPTGLALTRVIFGPLSRMQRFFTAFRRGQVRGGAAKAAHLVNDPEALKLFASIRTMRLGGRPAARIIQDLGGWDLFPGDIHKYIPGSRDGSGGEEFDQNNPTHRKAVADYVMFKLSQEGLDTDSQIQPMGQVRMPGEQ